ncbi:Hypothetical predicted protein [Xyrichtys novacula]|uniref:Uncharacterized protein n=1 Tax=Xyrichtys novacula TaxID=13765 RepID=A0AAV1HPS9_XYRNO|nr:Hypothetical predicted protein [Xyrichtys novacula]
MYLPELSSGSEAEPSPHNRHRPLLLTFALPRSAFLCCPKEEDQTQSEHHVCTSTANEANNEKEEHRVHSEGNMEKKKKNLMVHRSTDLLESRKRLKEETVMLMWTLEKVILDLKHDPGSSSDSLSCSQDQTQSEHHVCTSTANEANNEKEEHRVHSEGNMEKKKKNLMVHRSTDLLESRKRLKEETVMLMWTLEKVILDLKHDPWFII